MSLKICTAPPSAIASQLEAGWYSADFMCWINLFFRNVVNSLLVKVVALSVTIILETPKFAKVFCSSSMVAAEVDVLVPCILSHMKYAFSWYCPAESMCILDQGRSDLPQGCGGADGIFQDA